MTRLAFLRMLGMAPMARYGSLGQMRRRPDQQTDAPPSSVAPTQAAGTLRARRVIIFGTGPASGLFVYSGTPALGNSPIFTVTTSTTDPFGNGVIPNGAVSRSGTLFGELIAAALRFTDGSNPPFSVPTVVSSSALATGTNVNVISGKGTAGAVGVTATLYDSLSSPQLTAQVVIGAVINPVASSTTALLEVQGAIQTTSLNGITASGSLQSNTGDIIANLGNVNIATAGKGVLRSGETWHVVGAASQPPFLNSFTAGGTAPRFQVEAIGAGRVRLSGAVNTGAVTGANTAMFTLPVNYRPAKTFQFTTPNNVTAFTLGGTSVQVVTSGDVQLAPAGTAGKFVLLDGICFELD